jgi:hypothetical protein
MNQKREKKTHTTTVPNRPPFFFGYLWGVHEDRTETSCPPKKRVSAKKNTVSATHLNPDNLYHTFHTYVPLNKNQKNRSQQKRPSP